MKKHALVFLLLYLASRGLFAAADLIKESGRDRGLSPALLALAWPALAVSLFGLLVTSARTCMARHAVTCDPKRCSPFILVTFLALVSFACIGWAAVYVVLEPAAWLAFVSVAFAWCFTLGLVDAIRRERRAAGLPSARLIR